MPSGVLLFGGSFLALMALWAINHDDALGSSGIWTSWVSPGVRRAAAFLVLFGGLVMALLGAVR